MYSKALSAEDVRKLYVFKGGSTDKAAIPKPADDSGNILQRGIAAVAPGDRDYHGGKWAFHSVTWNVAPTGDLKSEAEVLQAAMADNVTITRVPENDFKCPVQP